MPLKQIRFRGEAREPVLRGTLTLAGPVRITLAPSLRWAGIMDVA
jgi:hypothetical protein